MTETEWLACADPHPMLNFLRGKVSERKLRLFACACCRRLPALLAVPRRRRAVEVAERFADGLADQAELERAGRSAARGCQEGGRDFSAKAPAFLTHADPFLAVHRAGFFAAFSPKLSRSALEAERQEQARLLRHIVGNPFQPDLVPSYLPSVLVQLAEAVYCGEEAAFALHDALLEAGQGELCEHFLQEGWHPKGCWAVDLLLGRK